MSSLVTGEGRPFMTTRSVPANMLQDETSNASVGRKRSAEKSGKEEQPRKKARHSCLACKTRKTKAGYPNRWLGSKLTL